MPDPTTRPLAAATDGTSGEFRPDVARPGPVLSVPADVVAALPYLLGHEPSDSLVAMGLRPDGRLGVVARVDLTAGPPSPGLTTGVAERLIAALVMDADEAAILASYDGSDPPQGPGHHAVALLGAVRAGLMGAGINTVDVLQVGPRRWRSLLCADTDCCPERGVAVDETRSRPVAVDFVLGGRSPATGRAVLEPASRRAPSSARRAATTAATRWRRGGGAGPDLSGRRFLLQDWVGLVDEHRRDGRLPSAGRSGRLAAGWVDDLRLRDACMVAVLPAAQLLPDALVAGVAADLQPVLADRACAGAVVAVAPVLRAMASYLGGSELAGVLAVHAWLSWASGSGAAAGDLAGRALAAAPGHRLAQLVDQLLDRAVPPDWAAPGRAVHISGAPTGRW